MPRAAHEAAGTGDVLEEYAPATTSSSAPARGALTFSGYFYALRMARRKSND